LTQDTFDRLALRWSLEDRRLPIFLKETIKFSLIQILFNSHLFFSDNGSLFWGFVFINLDGLSPFIEPSLPEFLSMHDYLGSHERWRWRRDPVILVWVLFFDELFLLLPQFLELPPSIFFVVIIIGLWLLI